MERHVGATTEARAAVLAARCAVLLHTIAGQGGPEPTDHLEQVRRLLARRRDGRARRRRTALALSAAASGRPQAVDPVHLDGLVHDLEVIEHALRCAARVGAGSASPLPA